MFGVGAAAKEPVCAQGQQKPENDHVLHLPDTNVTGAVCSPEG